MQTTLQVKNRCFATLMCAVALTTLSACAPLRPLQLQAVTNPTVQNLKNPQLRLEMVFYNPNAIGAKLLPSQLELLLQGRSVTVLHMEHTRLPARSSFSIPIQFEISYQELLAMIPSLVAAAWQRDPLEVELKGSLAMQKLFFRRQFAIYYRDTLSLRRLRIE